MNQDDLTMRLEELLAARDVAKQNGDENMFNQVQSGIAQVAGQMEQIGIKDPEAALMDMKVKRTEQRIQDERVNQAGQQGAALGMQRGMEHGYQQGYDAGNPVGAAAKRLAAGLFEPKQQPAQQQAQQSGIE